ncbi:LytR/AlgR family response regulator transcription factor [Algoriphagus boritolerans]|uniref:LytR/AlgR family response regulator transcription factor n=1 Tax=Algoriphagus boritolerans TaxID=308111 RepID=UPI000B0F373B
MIKAILIDDESQCRNSLSYQLKKYCPQVQLLAQCNSVEEGLKGIAQHHPELVFLDIEMPQMIGFEILQQLTATSFEVIFTTEYDNSISQTNRLKAIDFLHKPINKHELQNAVAKVSIKKKIFV